VAYNSGKSMASPSSSVVVSRLSFGEWPRRSARSSRCPSLRAIRVVDGREYSTIQRPNPDSVRRRSPPRCVRWCSHNRAARNKQGLRSNDCWKPNWSRGQKCRSLVVLGEWPNLRIEAREGRVKGAMPAGPWQRRCGLSRDNRTPGRCRYCYPGTASFDMFKNYAKN